MMRNHEAGVVDKDDSDVREDMGYKDAPAFLSSLLYSL